MQAIAPTIDRGIRQQAAAAPNPAPMLAPPDRTPSHQSAKVTDPPTAVTPPQQTSFL